MDIGRYVAQLRDDLTAAAAAGDEQTQRTAALLGAALEPAARLTLMNALADLAAEITTELGDRTVEGFRATRPHYSERDLVAKAHAAERFDPETAASVGVDAGEWMPAPGAIVVRADPSAFVDDDTAARLEARGVQVRSIPGAAHSVWYSHYDAFLAALPEVFG